MQVLLKGSINIKGSQRVKDLSVKLHLGEKVIVSYPKVGKVAQYFVYRGKEECVKNYRYGYRCYPCFGIEGVML